MNRLHSNTEIEYACIGRNVKISPLGQVVIDILHILFGGLHHLDQRVLKKVEWDDTYVIQVEIGGRAMATTDAPDLTQLVVLAHDACVRAAVCAKGKNKLMLIFHKRQRTGDISQRQDAIEEATANLRKHYTVGKEVE